MAPDDRDAVVDLTGLVIASPIGFMAALGLLRVCAQDLQLPVRLSWSDAHAQLHGVDREALVDALLGHMHGRADAPEFNFEVSDEKGQRGPVMHLRTITPEDYRRAVCACRDNPRALAFLAGYGTDAVVNDKGCIARTRLDFTSGQQRIVDEFRHIARMMDPDIKRQRVTPRLRIERALFGGAYEEQSSLGWDPATLMTHAHQPIAPTDSLTPGQPMLVWLAVEALPLHPVVPVGPRRAQTTGFDGASPYRWAQWSTPLSIQEATLLRQRPVGTLSSLAGVRGLWSSTVTSVGKYGILQPAARTPSVG